MLLALLVLPFWVSYLMRMLAWVNLLSADGWVNRFLEEFPIFGGPRNFLDANPVTVVLGLVYGYIPFLILPLYATLDRIDSRLLEAARDAGATARSAFFRVTLPLSKQGCLAAAVISRAADVRRLLHDRSVVAISEDIDDRQPDHLLHSELDAEAGGRIARADPVGNAPRAHGVLRVGDGPRAAGARAMKRVRTWLANSWGQPRALVVITWLYVVWSLAPVAVAVLFSFNSGRSRSVWQGFSLRWYWTDPFLSVRNDPTLRHALANSLILAALAILVAVPLGVALAIGMVRWRSRTARATRVGMLIPLVTPELVIGTSLFLVFTQLFDAISLGRPAQLIGHVTLSLSYVVIITRSRLLTIGPDLELAARDLGASPLQAVRLVLMPLLAPAVIASAVIVFATSIDDFVVSSFLSNGAGSETVPVKLYGSIRGGATPALNALATCILVATIGALVLIFSVMRGVRRRSGDEDASTSALRTVADLEVL